MLISKFALSYPKFVGHGYNSCITCHYNSQGNGALTDYGRALGASEISGKILRGNTSDEELGKSSNFLFMHQPLPFGIRPSLNYRGLYFSDNVGEDHSESTYINMQISANVAIKLDEKDKYTVLAEISYNPDDKMDDENNFRSREYYFRYMPTKNFVSYVGLMDKVFGVRFENHYLFSRSKGGIGLGQNDQSHGLIAQYQTDTLEIAGQYFLGNLHLDGDTEQSGLSTKFTYKPSSFYRLGASLLSSSSKYMDKLMYSLHGEMGLGHGVSVIGEIGQSQKSVSGSDQTSRYFLFQGTLRPFRGVYLYHIFEYYNQNIDLNNYTMRVGPGVQWFINQGVELRFDLLNQRRFADQEATEDDWEFLSQVHLWL